MDALEIKYERLLEAVEAASEATDADLVKSEEDEEEEEEKQAKPAKEAVMTVDRAPKKPAATPSLLQLARVRKALYLENEELRVKQMDFAKAHASLQHLLDVRSEDDKIGLSVDDVSASQLIIIARRFSIEECMEVSRVGYRRVAAYLDAQRNVPPPRTAMGWADRRMYTDDGVLRFCFSKHFARRSGEQLAAVTWSLLTSPRRVQKLYSHYLNMALHVVQKLDVNNYVCLRTINQTGQDTFLKSLFLLTRFETDRGFIVLAHGLDPARLDDDFFTIDMVGKRECWQDEFTWCVPSLSVCLLGLEVSYLMLVATTDRMLVEDDADGGGCRFSYGGAMLAEDPYNIFWGIEVLLIILRWETDIVAPLFTLRCN